MLLTTKVYLVNKLRSVRMNLALAILVNALLLIISTFFPETSTLNNFINITLLDDHVQLRI